MAQQLPVSESLQYLLRTSSFSMDEIYLKYTSNHTMFFFVSEHLTATVFVCCTWGKRTGWAELLLDRRMLSYGSYLPSLWFSVWVQKKGVPRLKLRHLQVCPKDVSLGGNSSLYLSVPMSRMRKKVWIDIALFSSKSNTLRSYTVCQPWRAPQLGQHSRFRGIGERSTYCRCDPSLS